jgi:hypothetical protein
LFTTGRRLFTDCVLDAKAEAFSRSAAAQFRRLRDEYQPHFYLMSRKGDVRPRRMALGHYMFFADLEGGQHEPRVREALDALVAYARRAGFAEETSVARTGNGRVC